ncbi:hypothetical protein M8J77_002678 [Diaphorina citri]|nr:hypothetical protein M8J77_002678 [Diaphorina citri]
MEIDVNEEFVWTTVNVNNTQTLPGETCLSYAAEKIGGELPQYHVAKSFADRRYKVSSARTYFYLNEATCERNVEIFQDCLHAVAGATYGTGITAIKLTALGRPQLLVSCLPILYNFISISIYLSGWGTLNRE